MHLTLGAKKKSTVVFWRTLGLMADMKREQLPGTRTLRSLKACCRCSERGINGISIHSYLLFPYRARTWTSAGRKGEPMYKRGHKRLNIERFWIWNLFGGTDSVTQHCCITLDKSLTFFLISMSRNGPKHSTYKRMLLLGFTCVCIYK